MRRIIHIIDVEKVNKNGSVDSGAVRVLETLVKQDGYDHRVIDISVEDLINQLTSSNIEIVNAGVDIENGKRVLIGTTGSLTRFASGQKPYVIISQISADGSNKVIGYRVASANGKVLKIRIEDLLKFATERTNRGDGVPFQNGQFVGTGDGAPYIRAYPGGEFLQEGLTSGRAKDIHTAVNDREKNLNRVNNERLGFTKQQLAEIEAARNAGVDIGIIANKLFSPRAMRALWQTEAKGFNTRPFADPAYKVEVIELLCVAIQNGIDVTPILNPKFTVSHIRELLVALEDGVDITDIADPNLSAREIYERVLRASQGIWCDAEVSKVGTSGGWERKAFRSRKEMQRNYEEWKKSFEVGE